MKKLLYFFRLLLTFNLHAKENKADVIRLVDISSEINEFHSIAYEISKQLSPSNRESFKKDMEPLFTKQKNSLVAYYAQNLSQSEVDNLIEFYQSPLAKKYLMVKQNYATVLSNRSETFKSEIQGIIMKYMM